MRCEVVRGQLADLVLDGTREGDDAAILRHLRACTGCADALEQERHVTSLLREWSAPDEDDETPSRLRLSVRAAIEADTFVMHRTSSFRRAAMAASIGAVAVLLGLAAVGRFGEPLDNRASAGPATKAEETGPGVFTMVGPFSKKERVEPKRSSERTRRVEPRSRRGVRKVAAPRTSSQPSPNDLGTVDSDSMIRFEFQTQDPAIRIIWFVPRADDTAETPTDMGD